MILVSIDSRKIKIKIKIIIIRRNALYFVLKECGISTSNVVPLLPLFSFSCIKIIMMVKIPLCLLYLLYFHF